MDPITITMWFLWGTVTGWAGTEILHGVFDKREKHPACQCEMAHGKPPKDVKCFKVYEKTE